MSKKQIKKQIQRLRRQRRVRSVISGTATVPRLSVHRSLRHVYAQLIDDATGVTLAASSDKVLSSAPKATDTMSKRVATAFAVGKDLAEKAKVKGIMKAVFDRGSYKYHGRVKALAEGARESGLEF